MGATSLASTPDLLVHIGACFSTGSYPPEQRGLFYDEKYAVVDFCFPLTLIPEGGPQQNESRRVFVKQEQKPQDRSADCNPHATNLHGG
jgi:hypothetical protein